MTNENQYFIKKMIDNRTILEIQKMLHEGKTYAQIKEVTGVSDGTIARVKSGKIEPNRKSIDEPLYTQKDIENLNYQLELTRKKVVELNALNYKLKEGMEKAKLLNEEYKKCKLLLSEFKKYGFFEKYQDIKKQEKARESQCSEGNGSAINKVNFEVNSFKSDKKTDKLDLF
ncbi:hypothetical protein [Clostridium perfringens]|uniref:hypothetical protein n=1 Tax=Clostridium perfringens TaxID=1502 RepID=UPI00293FEC82|nr:hypothetical protein [Clostridium perfringens]MDV5113575.1 hypothetical protein [Clostridium perfringens]